MSASIPNAETPEQPESFPALDAFAASLGFPLDGFQRTACERLESGRSVLVAAPTG